MPLGQLQADSLLSAPVTLLVSLWAAGAIILAMMRSCHALRDIVLGVKPLTGLSAPQVRRIKVAALWHSYIWIWLGILGFLIILIVFVIFLSANVARKVTAKEALRANAAAKGDREEIANIDLEISVLKTHRWLALAGALVPAFGLFGFLIGGCRDVRAMRSAIREVQEVVPEVTRRAADDDDDED